MQKTLAAQEKRLREQEKKNQAQDKRSDAQDYLNAVTAIVNLKMTDLRGAATLLGTAYSKAAKRHRDAVDGQKQMNALDTQLMFAALGVLTAGALSWATELANAAHAASVASKTAAATAANAAAAAARAQNSELQYAASLLSAAGPFSRWAGGQASPITPVRNLERFITVTSSTISTGVGSVLGLAPSFIPLPPTEPVSEEPLEFQNKLVAKVDTILLSIQTSLVTLAVSIQNTSIDEWEKYDAAKFKTAFDEWQKEVSKFAGTADLPSEEDMAKEVERSIWALWIPSLHREETKYTTRTFHGEQSTFERKEDVYERVRQPVNDRFVALGIETKEQTDWDREKEDKFLVEWSKKYLREVKPWVSGKANGRK